MKLTSPAFPQNGNIPRKHTCQGWNANPELVVENIPEGTQSLALIIEDPDAPRGAWVHWIVYNIPVVNRIEQKSVPGKQLMNSFGKRDYGGPCPPAGERHRYVFSVLALNHVLNVNPGIDRLTFERMIQPHMLEKAELVGFYKKF